MGGMGDGGREVQERGDIHIHKGDSLRCTAETNTALLSNSTPIKKKKRGLEMYLRYISKGSIREVQPEV